MEKEGIGENPPKSMTLEQFLIQVLSGRDSYLSADVTLSAETKNPIIQLRCHRLGSIGFEVSGDTMKVVTYTPKPKKTEREEIHSVCCGDGE